jgi:FkbM family methyltransferase
LFTLQLSGLYNLSVVMRRILKLLPRGIVLKRHLPKEFAKVPFFVSPDSALAYWRFDLRKVDRFLLAMARQLVRGPMKVWDIGANVGLFSFSAASLGAEVLAVEPDIWLAHLMQRSIGLNKLPVTILPVAIADRKGISALHLSDEGKSSNSLIGSGHKQRVLTLTLDSLLEVSPAPDVIKIDVEGAEYEVLKGARKVFDCRPLIFCEITQNHELIGNLLTEMGYTFYAARALVRQPLGRPSRDTIAVPSERREFLSATESAAPTL